MLVELQTRRLLMANGRAQMGAMDMVQKVSQLLADLARARMHHAHRRICLRCFTHYLFFEWIYLHNVFDGLIEILCLIRVK